MSGELTNAVTSRIRNKREPGRWENHAALEAIDVEIRDASAAESALARHIGWLQDVKRRRKQEIEKGDWPPRSHPDSNKEAADD